MASLQEIFDKFSRVKVLVAGDVMLDRYWWGTVDRISPEAPVPVVRLNRSESTAGGAANVAANVAGLGATPFLVGLIGDDREGHELSASLVDKNIDPQHLQISKDRPTTVKTRVVAHSHHVVRVDNEHTHQIGESESAQIGETLIAMIAGCDVVLLSDYAKGFLSDHLLARIFAVCAAHSKPVLVDPKGREYAKYKGASLLTPNRGEAVHAAGVENLDVAAQKLLDEVALESLIITQGEHGMTLYRKNAGALNFPAMARKVYDVTGAGDTVISTLAVALGAGCDLEQAAAFANSAAGIVVESVGTTVIQLADLKRTLEQA
jgi:rfaE bifunctional protein kinase chain/domain